MAIGVTYTCRNLWRHGGWVRLLPAGLLLAAVGAFVLYVPLWTFSTIPEGRFDLLTPFSDWGD